MAVAGMTTTSARWPGMSRPRSVSRARARGTDALGPQRPVERELLGRPEGRCADRPARILPTDGQGEARPRVERLDRRIRPEREDRAGRRERRPRIAVGLGAGAPQPSGRDGIRAEMARLDARHDPVRRESPAIGRGHELHVFDPRHQGQGRSRAAQRVQRRADGGIADRVDLRGDPGRGGRPDQVCPGDRPASSRSRVVARAAVVRRARARCPRAARRSVNRGSRRRTA